MVLWIVCSVVESVMPSQLLYLFGGFSLHASSSADFIFFVNSASTC